MGEVPGLWREAGLYKKIAKKEKRNLPPPYPTYLPVWSK